MPSVEAVLLGIAQDAGVPQAGCRCQQCVAAREDSSLSRYPVSLALINHDTRGYWIIDASPALNSQLDFLIKKYPDFRLLGVVLTHAHTGHYTGLIHLGKEAWNVDKLPVYASSKMFRFLSSNEPWASILTENLSPVEFAAGERINLAGGIAITPVAVQHRAEFTDTFAFFIDAGGKGLFYCPDIDAWDDFDLDLWLASSVIALLDGTFYSDEELPGRDLGDIPHPLVTDTVASVFGSDCDVWLVHLNHTNPLNDIGPELDRVISDGVGVAEQWQVWQLR